MNEHMVARTAPVDDIIQPTLFSEPEPAQLPLSGDYAEIVFDRPLDHAYTYAVPQGLRGSLAVGKRVLAPFGKGDRHTVGYCVGLTAQVPGRAVKNLLAVLDEESLLTPHLLKLTRWMADYYLCGWGQVLNAVLPAGVKQQAGTRSVTLIERVPADLRPSPPPALSAKQQAVLEFLESQPGPIELRQVLREAKCGLAPVRALIDRGLVRRRAGRTESAQIRTSAAAADEPASDAAVRPEALTPDQLSVWAMLEQAVRGGGFKPFLLYGVTGSGKTEIYLRAIEEVLRQGKEALVLVPEISLTPQTIRSFQGRCGQVAVLHSHLHNAERGNYWRRIARGEVQVIVGARSAVFAPTRNLGLIVIDEEHENSFKQEATPRYHARDVAVMRARLENIPIILGSATPALESWHNAQRGQYTLLTLPRRVHDRPLPHVHLIDLCHDRDPAKRLDGISPPLERSMRQALGLGGQVILLLNRRGFSTYLHCPGCGHVQHCRFCDLAMTFHRERHIILCHYCGYEQVPPEKCPACGTGQVRYQGMGTEKLESEIKAKFPDKVVGRMDSDTMKRHGSHGKVLDAFKRGEIHILMGTQMIAKGLDFPNVTLVGVVNADVGLHHADFRAAERTFQLLAQVAGRTGRGARGGHVFVQTMSPEHPSIALAAAHDYRRFAEAEMRHRRAHNYPPVQRLARLIVRSKDEKAAHDYADRLAAAFRPALEKLQQGTTEPIDLRLLGPAECPVFRLKGYYRFHFQLQSSRSGFLHQVLRAVLPAVRLPKDVELTVDIDPQDML
jgi:primosomal protein N' (replication factor Y) (superfamily II helicase)